MNTFKFLLPTFFFICTGLLVAQDAYTVTAKSGLTIRKEPNVSGEKIGKLENGMMVYVIEKTDYTLTITDNGKQVRGNWVKVTLDHIPKFSSTAPSGFVFDGFLEKVNTDGTSYTSPSRTTLELYKLTSSENTTNRKVGFVSLTDGYPFQDDDNSSIIAKKHLGDQDFKNDNYHQLEVPYRSRFLKTSGIQETDSIFIYHFSSDTTFKEKIENVPVAAKINPYGAQMPVNQNDYMVGFEIGEAILRMDELTNYYATTLAYIGRENPFVKGRLRPVLWEKVDAKRFPISDQVAKDSTITEKKPPNDTFEFTAGGLNYFLQNRTRDGQLYARHFKVLSSDNDTLLFDKVYNSGEGAALLSLNTILNKKQNIRIAIWTGKLFKNRPPIITDLISHSFGCPDIYFLEQSVPSIRLRCDNRR